MDKIKFNELVEEVIKTIGFTRKKAEEYVAISEGLSVGDVIIVPDDMIDDEEDSDIVLQ